MHELIDLGHFKINEYGIANFNEPGTTSKIQTVIKNLPTKRAYVEKTEETIIYFYNMTITMKANPHKDTSKNEGNEEEVEK